MCARAATQAAGRSHVKDGRLCYAPQLRRPRDLPGVRAGSASRGQHQLQSEFEPTGTPGVMQGKGSPGRCGCTWMASSSRKTSSRSPPHRLQPPQADLRRQPRLGGHHRLPGPVPIHRHPARRHRRPVWRPDHGHRGRDGHGHGPPVTPAPRTSARLVIPSCPSVILPARPLSSQPLRAVAPPFSRFSFPQQAAQFVEAFDLLGLGYHKLVTVHDDRVVTAGKGPTHRGQPARRVETPWLTLSTANAIESNIMVTAAQKHPGRPCPSCSDPRAAQQASGGLRPRHRAITSPGGDGSPASLGISGISVMGWL
jgi:hypothetical protein